MSSTTGETEATLKMSTEVRTAMPADAVPGDKLLETENGSTVEDNKPTLTKTQLKKLKKKEKKEQMKVQKRKAEKERLKARKRACRERGEDLGPSRKQLRHNKMSKSSCKIKVAVDCDFDNYMSEKDIKMLVKQIQFCYSANRRALDPLQFYCCGVSGKTQSRLENIGDYKGWDINFHKEGYLDVFDKESVVYLSSDSPNILSTLEEGKVYIIGGLVDHNHHKGLCHRLAEEKGISHAQLPIAEYIEMKTRKVFTINHVFEMLLRFTESNNWQKAFYTVLPFRKGAVLKQGTSQTNGAEKGDVKEAVEEDNFSQSDEEIIASNDNQTVQTAKTADQDNEVPDSKDSDLKDSDATDRTSRSCLNPMKGYTAVDNLFSKSMGHPSVSAPDTLSGESESRSFESDSKGENSVDPVS